MQRSRLVKNFLSCGIALVCLVVLLASLYQTYDSLQAQDMVFSPVEFSISLFPLVLSYFFVPSMWCEILMSFGVSLPYRQAFCIQYLSHLGKYIPGKIWGYAAQSYLASRAHVSLAETLCSNIMLMCLLSLSSLLVFALSFLVWNIFTFLIRCLIVVSGFSLIYCLFRAHLLEKIFNFFLAHCTGMYHVPHCESLYYTNICIASSLGWATFTVGLYFMVKSFYPINIQQTVVIVGTFSISWLGGYYSFLTPGGLGVQEGLQVYLLTSFFPLPISIVIALASRLWMTVGDVLIFLLALMLTIRDNRLPRSIRGLHP
jgi:hypothetical protein